MTEVFGLTEEDLTSPDTPGPGKRAEGLGECKRNHLECTEGRTKSSAESPSPGRYRCRGNRLSFGYGTRGSVSPRRPESRDGKELQELRSSGHTVIVMYLVSKPGAYVSTKAPCIVDSCNHDPS